MSPTLFGEVCEILGIHKTQTTPLHPQSDGMVERYNCTIEAQLSAVVEAKQKDWDKHVPLLLGRPQEEANFQSQTKYAQDLRQRIETVHDFARANSLNAGEQMKRRHDTQGDADPFTRGDLVWLHNPQRKKGISPKLARGWEGPYAVLAGINDVVHRVQQSRRSKSKVVHCNRLWQYQGRESADWFNAGEETMESRSTLLSPGPTTAPATDVEQQPTQEVPPKASIHVDLPSSPSRSSSSDPGPRRSSRPRRHPRRFTDYVMDTDFEL